MSARPARPRPPPQFKLETLETRVLFSADSPLIALGTLPPGAPLETRLEVQVAFNDAVPVQTSSTSIEANAPRELVIIDAGVPDIDALLADFAQRGNDSPEVIVFAEGSDPLKRLGDILAGEQALDAVHLISHGADGALEIGGQQITVFDLLAQADEITAWRDAFADDADLLLYGCDVAGSTEGRVFVDTLARLSGADVAASDDITGNSADGGDWVLEYRRGDVQGDVAFSQQLQQDFTESFATYTVTNLNDSGDGSLRQAIIDSNSSGTDDEILFNVAGTVNLLSELPSITDTVVIDATTAPDYNGSPVVTLDGINAQSGSSGIRLGEGSDNSVIKGLEIINFRSHGIEIDTTFGVVIASNYIGTDGISDQGNTEQGIYLTDSSDIVIGGAGEGNVISGNERNGIWVIRGSDNIISGNMIGTNAAGDAIISNERIGVEITSSANNIVGGDATAGEGNLISGNASFGIHVRTEGAINNQIIGNYIGTDLTGTVALGNESSGVRLITGATGTSVGGLADGERNIISGNGESGIFIAGANEGIILGNYIGTDSTGISTVANTGQGVEILSGSNNSIGSGMTGGTNLISGNTENGIKISGTTAILNVVSGNKIGTDVSGTLDRGNGANGILIESGASSNTIGGTQTADSNRIVHNGSTGISVTGESSNNNAFLGNLIYDNTSLGIDLGADGVTVNDLNTQDADTGPNALQNKPELTRIVANNGGRAAVEGALHGESSVHYRIEFFASNTAGPDNAGEAVRYLGVAERVLTNDQGFVQFTQNLSAVSTGEYITATATRDLGSGAYGNSSEFSTQLLNGEPNENSVSLESSSDFTAAENQTIVGTITATDNNGASLSYSIQGGDDVSLFDIGTASGELSFKSAPDFEVFTDNDNDGVYEVIVRASDGNGAIDDQTLLVTVTDVNEPAVVGGDSTGDVIEGDVGDVPETRATGTISISDVDADEQPVFEDVDSTPGINGYGTFVLTDSTWTYTLDQSAVQDLGAGDVVTDTITYTATDDSTQQIVVTITGTDDGAVIAGDSVGSVAEGDVGDAPETRATGTISISDVDADEQPVFEDVDSTPGINGYGTFALTDSTWTYTLDQSAVQDLGAGDVVTDTITYTATDDSTQKIVVTITGTDDGAVIAGEFVGSVAEGDVGDAPETRATGTISISDVDADEQPVFEDVDSTPGINGYGTFALTDSTWTYTLDQSAVQNLDAGDVVTDMITYTATDDSSQQIVVTITGTDDSAVIEGEFVGSVAEGDEGDAPETTATGTISISDVDTDDSPEFKDVDSTPGDNGYGTFALIDGTWTYTLTQSAVQNLDAGDRITDTITYTATNDSTLPIVVTIAGTNDAPIITSDAAVSIPENTSIAITVTSNDADADSTATYSIIGGSDQQAFSIDESSGQLAFVSAPDFERQSSYSVEVDVTDSFISDSQNLTVTIVNVDEAPVTVDDVITTDEDTAKIISIATDLLANDTDPEGGPLSLINVTSPEHGELADAVDGTLEYRPSADFNGFDGFDYTVADSSGNETRASVVIEINSVNDAPVLASSMTDNVDSGPLIIDETAFDIGFITVEENAINVARVDAVDVDNQPVRFALEGADASFFNIDATTGELSLKAPFNFEIPDDENQDNNYELEFVLFDGSGGVSRLQFSIAASNVNETPTIEDSLFTLSEGFTGLVGQLNASDPDRDDQLVFELVNIDNNDSVGELSLSPDGILRVADALIGTHVLEVRVVDTAGLMANGRITIDVDESGNTTGEPQITEALPIPPVDNIDTDEIASVPDEIISVPDEIVSVPDISDQEPQEITGLSPFESATTLSTTLSLLNNLNRLGSTDSTDSTVDTDSLESMDTSDASVILDIKAASAISDPPNNIAFVQIESVNPFNQFNLNNSENQDIATQRTGAEFFRKEKFSELQRIIKLVPPLTSSFPAAISAELLDAIEILSRDMDEAQSKAMAERQFKVTLTTTAGVTLSVGAALWLLQSRLLLAAALTAMPLWRSFDPIPVLVGVGAQDDIDDIGGIDDKLSSSDERQATQSTDSVTHRDEHGKHV